MPGATPAGSPGGTGVSHCQQQAPVVGRFVFPLSFVLRVSPRTRLSSSSPGVFWAWIRQVYTPLMSWMIVTGADPVTTPAEAQADLPKSRGEGRQLLAPQQRQLSCTAAHCTAPRQRQTLLFLGASTHQQVPRPSC